MKSCGTCRFFREIDARRVLDEPQAKFMCCVWKPKQAYWIAPPYLAQGFSSLMVAQRNAADGTDCETYEFETLRGPVGNRG